MDDAELNDALTKVAAYSRQLGLGGVMILSPICDGCGCMHDFKMLADWHVKDGGDDIDPKEIGRLLLRFAAISQTEPEDDRVIERHGRTH